MAYFRRKFYYNENNMPDGLKPIYAGFDLLQSHPLFSQLDGTIAVKMHIYPIIAVWPASPKTERFLSIYMPA